MSWDGSTLAEAVRDGDDGETVSMVKRAIADGVAPIDVLEEGLIPGIQELGDLFKDGEVFLPEVLI